MQYISRCFLAARTNQPNPQLSRRSPINSGDFTCRRHRRITGARRPITRIVYRLGYASCKTQMTSDADFQEKNQNPDLDEK